MTDYILTEAFHGDYEGKLGIIDFGKSLPRLVKKRQKIITERTKPSAIFGPADPEQTALDLEIWEKKQ